MSDESVKTPGAEEPEKVLSVEEKVLFFVDTAGGKSITADSRRNVYLVEEGSFEGPRLSIRSSYPSAGGRDRMIGTIAVGSAGLISVYPYPECCISVREESPGKALVLGSATYSTPFEFILGDGVVALSVSRLDGPSGQIPLLPHLGVRRVGRDVPSPSKGVSAHLDLPETEGRKDDRAKTDWSLLPWGAAESVVKVLEFGQKKYGRDNWKKVPEARRRYFSAGVRHLIRHLDGEKLDQESGLPHLAHAACCVLFMLQLDLESK